MELDVSFDNESLSIPIENPFHLDVDTAVKQIEGFLSVKVPNLNGLDLKGLIPKMIRGIAGCEDGCPANAKALVSKGFKNFQLSYIEGGILSAQALIGNKMLHLKMFPEF